MKKVFLLLALCLCANVCLAQTSIQGRQVDVRAFGAKCDGTTNDLTAIGAAITAVTATGGVVNLPDGTCISEGTLTIPGGVTLRGKGKFVSIIKSSTDGVILDLVQGSGAFAFFGPKVQDLWVDGSDSGSSQIGIKVDDALYLRDAVVENVTISDMGSHGLYVGNAFSSEFRNVYSDSNQGYPFYVLSANMPSNRFVGLYAGEISAAAPAGFRIRQGRFYCYTCNGINASSAGSAWAIVGDKIGVDGAVANVAAYARWEDCNIESWRLYGVRHYSNSYSDFAGNNFFAGDATASGVAIAALYEQDPALFPWSFTKGIIADTTIFANSPASFFANSEPIHSNDIAPLLTEGQGPKISGGGFISTYRNTTNSRSESIYRADSYQPSVVVTATINYDRPGATAFVINCAAPCTLTLPSPDYYTPGQSVSIKNISADGVAITIAANGSTIDGGGSYAMSLQNESIILYPYAAGADWKVIASTPVAPGSVDFYSLYGAVNRVKASGSLISNSGSNLLFTGTTLYGTDNTLNIGTASDNRPANIYAATAVTSPTFFIGGGGPCIKSGSGDPEGVSTCEPGSLYQRTNGSWYIKASGSGNTGWSLVSTSGVPTVTATRIPYGDPSNLMTTDANLTWTSATKILTITSASTGFIDLTTTSTAGALRTSGGTHPAQGGGVIFPFIGGDIASGPGVWWCSGAYASCSGLFTKFGLNWQGAASHDNFKIRAATPAGTEGALRWDFQPTNSVFAETLETSATSAAFTGHTIALATTGTAAANFGYGQTVALEDSAGNSNAATSIVHAWNVATDGSETSEILFSTNLGGAGVGQAFAISGGQYYGSLWNKGNISGAVTLDFINGNTVTATLTGNVTSLAFSNLQTGGVYYIHFIQDALGPWTLAVPAELKVNGGYTITASINARDLLICSATSTTQLYCAKAQDQQ